VRKFSRCSTEKDASDFGYLLKLSREEPMILKKDIHKSFKYVYLYIYLQHIYKKTEE
jgi:hypothetical protein